MKGKNILILTLHFLDQGRLLSSVHLILYGIHLKVGLVASKKVRKSPPSVSSLKGGSGVVLSSLGDD